MYSVGRTCILQDLHVFYRMYMCSPWCTIFCMVYNVLQYMMYMYSTCMHACMHARTHARTHTHTHTHIYTHIYTYTQHDVHKFCIMYTFYMIYLYSTFNAHMIYINIYLHIYIIIQTYTTNKDTCWKRTQTHAGVRIFF